MPRRQVREPAFAVIFVLLTSFCVTHAHADSTSLGECGEPATLISTIQGTENASKSAERGTVVVEGVVVGDFQQTSFNGFYVEEEDAQQDSNPNTSEGIFVFQGANAAPVAAGDVVRVMGTVFEFEELTELTGPVQLKVCPQKAQVTPKVLKLPISDRSSFSLRVIGNPLVMRVTPEIDQSLHSRDGRPIHLSNGSV